MVTREEVVGAIEVTQVVAWPPTINSTLCENQIPTHLKQLLTRTIPSLDHSLRRAYCPHTPKCYQLLPFTSL